MGLVLTFSSRFSVVMFYRGFVGLSTLTELDFDCDGHEEFSTGCGKSVRVLEIVGRVYSVAGAESGSEILVL